MNFNSDVCFRPALLNVFQITNYIISDQYGRIYFSGTLTCITHLSGINFHFRSDTLTSDLHKAKLTEWKYGMLRSITSHHFFHMLHQLSLILRISHIDEVDDDKTSDIP